MVNTLASEFQGIQDNHTANLCMRAIQVKRKKKKNMLTLLSFSDHIQIYPPNKQESNGLNQTHVYYVMQERKKSPWSALKQVGISSKGEKTNVCNTIIIRSPFRENDNFSFFAVSTHFY